MSYSATDFFNAYPKYACMEFEYSHINRLIDLANSFIGDCWNEPKKNQAIGLIVAHNIEAGWMQQISVSGAAGVAAGGGNGGGVASVENDFSTTHYGRMYLLLKRTIPNLPMSF